MRKELTLSDLSKGGRKRDDIYDVLGIRAVVHPKSTDRSRDAEAMAVDGCYLIRDLAFRLWPVIPERCKDYIKHPKINGYRSLHSTHIVPHIQSMIGSESISKTTDVVSYPLLEDIHDGMYVIDDPLKQEELLKRSRHTDEGIPFELQIRTKAMEDEAESGTSSHALYKSGFGV